MGGLDAVVNNAGIDATEWYPVHEWPVEEFDRILATNLRGPFLVSRAAIPHLIAAGGGSFVHMSSVCAITVWAGDVGYDVSKAGLNMLSDHIATEYGPQGIRSNTLMPGVIRTEMHESVMEAMDDGRAFERELLGRHPVGRFGTVEEVAEATLFLLRDGHALPHGRERLHRRRVQPGLAQVRITDVRTHVLLDPAFDPGATSSAQDTIVVEVETDAGVTGVGETDLNAWIARACIEAPGTHTMDRGLRALLLGQDPLDPEAVWERLYVGTCMSGRRGALIHALGALDIALWDICGQAAGVPCWQLLGERARDDLTPYASLQPETETYDAFLRVDRRLGGPRARDGLPRGQAGGDVRRARTCTRAWSGPTSASRRSSPARGRPSGRTSRSWSTCSTRSATTSRARCGSPSASPSTTCSSSRRPCGPTTSRATGSSRRARRCAWPPASGCPARHEFRELLERGGVQVAQPDVGRVGGLTEARRICALAAQHERLVVPHAWKTGISVAVAAHLAMVTPHMPFFEFLPAELCESRAAPRADARRARLPRRPPRAAGAAGPGRRARPRRAGPLRRGRAAPRCDRRLARSRKMARCPIASPGPLVSADWLAAHLDEVRVVDVRWYLDGRSGRAAYESGHLAGRRLGRHRRRSRRPADARGWPPPAADAGALRRRDGAARHRQRRRGRRLRRRVGLDRRAALVDAALARRRGGGARRRPAGVARAADHRRAGAAHRPLRPAALARGRVRRHGARRRAAQRRPGAARRRARARPASAARTPAGSIRRPGHVPAPAARPGPTTSTRRPDACARRRSCARATPPSAPARRSVVVASCGSGVTACHDLLALEVAGFEHLALYPGSWSAWSADPDRPAATGPA